MKKRNLQLRIWLTRNPLRLFKLLMSRWLKMGLLLNQLVRWQMVARLDDVAHGLSIKRNKREEDMNKIPVYSVS